MSTKDIKGIDEALAAIETVADSAVSAYQLKKRQSDAARKKHATQMEKIAIAARAAAQRHLDEEAERGEVIDQLEYVVDGTRPDAEPAQDEPTQEQPAPPVQPTPEAAPQVDPPAPPAPPQPSTQAFLEILENTNRTVKVSGKRSKGTDPVLVTVHMGDSSTPYTFHDIKDVEFSHTYANTAQNRFNVTLRVRDGSSGYDKAERDVTVQPAVIVTQPLPVQPQFNSNPRTWGKSFWIWALAVLGVIIAILAVWFPTYQPLMSHHHVPWAWLRDLLRVVWALVLASAGFFIGARVGWEIEHHNDSRAETQEAHAA